MTDTLVNSFNPADTIVTVLKNLQDSVADQRKQLVDQLLERAANLRYNNSIITSRINQMLRDIEEEEMNASMERVVKKQEVLRETSYLIGGIAILSLIIVVVFIILITRDISRSQYYRQQLEKAKQYAEDLLHSPGEVDADDQPRYPCAALVHNRLYRTAAAPSSGRKATLLFGKI